MASIIERLAGPTRIQHGMTMLTILAPSFAQNPSGSQRRQGTFLI
jgi:hypothetical protein